MVFEVTGGIVAMCFGDVLCFVFFFFKQKTAYEMLRSLVGSEMCIRDRANTEQWAVADENGKFEIRNIPRGKNTISVSCLCLSLIHI